VSTEETICASPQCHLPTSKGQIFGGMEHVLIVAATALQLRIVVWLFLGERRTLRASFIAGTFGGPAFRVLAVPGGA
jgi:hypothetical protein